MTQPVSIRLFAVLATFSALFCLGVAIIAARNMTFGFPIAPEAAATLSWRIQAIRMFGFLFAIA
ncbi:MAG: hypothetical protein M3R41_08890, partial [Pseudomonadota bacterium]|nr:hypothetical protein [Pseudomonadota bacterium]